MRKITEITLIALSILVSFTIKAQNTGTVIEEFIPSESIKNNIWGDTLNPKAIVYLPPSYYNSDTEFPVIYYLTGSFMEVNQMFDSPPYPLKLNLLMDSLINNRIIREVIVVVATTKVNIFDTGVRMPTLYTNSPINGNWEDFIVKDLVSYIDNKYRTIDNRLNRGLTGHSMGGYGTYRLALLYPDKFGYAYSMSYGPNNIPELRNPYNKERELLLNSYLKESQNLSFEDGVDLLVKYAKHRNMVWVFATRTSFKPKLEPPFFETSRRIVNDSIVIDSLKDIELFHNKNEAVDSFMVIYNSHPKKLKEIVMEVGLKDGETFIQGCNYASSIFIENNIPHQVIYTKFGHIDGLKYQMLNSMLPYFSRHLGLTKEQNLYNP